MTIRIKWPINFMCHKTGMGYVQCCTCVFLGGFPPSCEDNNSTTFNDRNPLFAQQFLTIEQMILLDFCKRLLHKFAY